MNPEIETLRAIMALCQTRIDRALAENGIDEIVWASTAQHEQRCRRCGLWITAGSGVALIRYSTDLSGTIRKDYVHRECVREG